jgi:hypothetical protein
MVTFLVTELKKAQLEVACLHGVCVQDQRESAMRGFKAGKSRVLVATDIAARGLHVQNLPYIVNYDFPSNLETYNVELAAWVRSSPCSQELTPVWTDCFTHAAMLLTPLSYQCEKH